MKTVRSFTFTRRHPTDRQRWRQRIGKVVGMLLGGSAIGIAAWEVRGAVTAGPTLLAMFTKGPTWMQAWILFCIALSMIAPIAIARWWKRRRA